MGPYIQQTLLLLLAPALFAASVYMMLGRIVVLLDAEDLCIFRKKWLTKFFVCGDILSFTVQAAGEQTSHLFWLKEAKGLTADKQVAVLWPVVLSRPCTTVKRLLLLAL
jgi:hypothetical protein